MKRSIRFLSLLVLALWTGGNAWALEQDSNGAYQIANGDDLIEFANLVNGDADMSGSNAVLTADIDLTGKEYPTIGRDASRYWGIFDGQGHRILNMTINGTTKELGFFNVCSSATIKNLILDASCNINSGDCTAALIGCCNGSGTLAIENVGVECDVKGTGPNAAAFVGCNYGSIAIQIKNCYNTGNITAERESAVFSGWFGNNSNAKVENSWNTGKVTGLDGQNSLGRGIGASQFVNTYDLNSENNGIDATKLANYESSWLASGQLAYVMNGNKSTDVVWYQKLGDDADAHPYPFGTAIVYANGALKCDGTSAGDDLVYSNESSSVTPPHSYADGFCSVCGTVDQDYLTVDSEGFYNITTANELKWFAAMIEKVDQSLNAKLTNDIDYTANKQGFIGVSQSIPFRGVFDGQEHIITIDIVNNGSGRTGLFAYINAATIKNLIVEGSATSAGNNCVGGLGGRSDGNGTLIENVVVKTDVSYTGSNGDATCGGFFANMEATITMKNCAFYGSINTGTAEGNGGLVGWAGNGENIKFENCIVAPTNYTKNGNSADFARNNPSVTNCFMVDSDDPSLASGEMTWKLNGEASGGTDWYQAIGSDPLPMPFGTAIVYANGQLYCDGHPKPDSAFENEEKEATRDNHTFGEWGFCIFEHDGTLCDAIQPEFAALEDGVYQITNAKELNWLAVWTDHEDASVKAVMTQDIDMSEVANFPGLGSGARNFTGEFDGQRHILSNLKMEWTDRNEGVGFVNRAANGAKVKNLTIANTCSFKGNKAVGGIIGGLYGGGDVYIDNCGNEGAVETTGQNAGGIVGVCFNGTILHLTNVYNIGTITGDTAGESGSLSGWMANAVIKNCYSVAGYPTAEDTHGFQEGNQFARGNGIELTNCYDFGTGDWGTNNGDWGSAFGDGRKIADAGDETEMSRVFAGLFDGEGGNVWRMEYNGDWAHPVLYDTDMVLKENNYNRFVAADDVDLTLVRTTVANTWNTICLPFDVTDPTTLFGAGAKVAELQSLEGTTLKFSVVSAIEAGKPYLVLPTEAMTEKALTGVSLVAGTTDIPAGNLTFTGVYDPTAAAAGSLFISTGNKLSESNGEGTIKAFRAYFQVAEGGAKAVDFVVDDVATGIINIDGTVLTDGSTYDLQGRRVSVGSANAKPARGLYIVNGKKTIVK